MEYEEIPSREEVFWIAPVQGLFVPIQERYPIEHLQGLTIPPLVLEEGVTWRLTPTPEDRDYLNEWFTFYGEVVAKSEGENLAGADTLLIGDPAPVEDQMPPFVACFVVAASLHLGSPVRSQMLRFHEREGRVRPHSGYSLHSAMGLGGQPLQQLVPDPERRAIAETYRVVRRCFDHEEEHAFRRAIAAYRAASGITFVDGTAILLCAALEALAADDDFGVVIRRLVPKYLESTAEAEAERRLKRLYLLRHWFAHSVNIPQMRDRAARHEAFRDGYVVVKEVLRRAVRDDALEAAVSDGVKAVKAYLDES